MRQSSKIRVKIYSNMDSQSLQMDALDRVRRIKLLASKGMADLEKSLEILKEQNERLEEFKKVS